MASHLFSLALKHRLTTREWPSIYNFLSVSSKDRVHELLLKFVFVRVPRGMELLPLLPWKCLENEDMAGGSRKSSKVIRRDHFGEVIG